jgi:two-component system, NarL family, sensor kinase
MRGTAPAPAGSRKQRRVRNLLSAQEEQNKSLARELHDVVSQKLAALGMEIGTLDRKPPKSRAELRARVRQISSRVTALAVTMHEISRRLHPAILEDLGLVEALNGECTALSELYGNPVTFGADNVPKKLPDNVTLCVYRIAQESLRNICRHAPGAAVSVKLAGGPGEIKLSVADGGPGFPPRPARSRGLGLIGMEERARLVKGKLRVISTPGKGTVVEVRVPLPPSARSGERRAHSRD